MGLSTAMQVNSFKDLPPSLDQWHGMDSNEDLAHACEIFLGKTNAEISKALDENYIIRCLDLSIMPDSVFNYYATGFIDLLISKSSSDARSGVLIGALLDAISTKGRSSPALWLDFWRARTNVLDIFQEKVNSIPIDIETKDELLQEIDDIRSALRASPL
jgi:hypothetical protein